MADQLLWWVSLQLEIYKNIWLKNSFFSQSLSGVLSVRELEKILLVSVFLFFFTHSAVEISLLGNSPEASHWTLFATVLTLNVGLGSICPPALVLRKIRLISINSFIFIWIHQISSTVLATVLCDKKLSVIFSVFVCNLRNCSVTRAYALCIYANECKYRRETLLKQALLILD